MANEIYDNIIQAMVGIEKGVTIPDAQYQGTIQNAYDYIPSQLPSSECPFFINDCRGGAVEYAKAGGLMFVNNTIFTVLCVQRREASTNVSDVIREAIKWRTAVLDCFASAVTLHGMVNVIDVQITKWDMVNYPISDMEYISLLFEVMVREQFVAAVMP